LHTAKKLLSRVIEVLPKTAQSEIRERYWQTKSKLLYQSLYRFLDLEHTLQSGLIVKVASKGEWWIYNDIFVDGEYDIPIRTALQSAPCNQPFVVLDLGANVGYFAFRLVDLMDSLGRCDVDLDITMVEGSPQTFLELQKRIRSQQQLASSCRMVHGLVGQRSGSALIRESAVHVKATIVDVPDGRGVNVPFVDLNALMANKTELDLLKCDIEGAELLFIENYEDLLHKVKHAVIEFHHEQCNTQKCLQMLKALGFRHRVLRTTESFSVSFLSRS